MHSKPYYGKQSPAGWWNVCRSTIDQLLILPKFLLLTFSKQVSWRNRALVISDWGRRFIFGRDSSGIWGRQPTNTGTSNCKLWRIFFWPSFTIFDISENFVSKSWLVYLICWISSYATLDKLPLVHWCVFPRFLEY